MSSSYNPTRRKILKASWQLLEAENPENVRLGDIAKQAGISRQALYLHFANRAELLVETARFVDQEKGVDARLEPSRNASSGRERLRHYCAFWTDYLPEIQGCARAFLAMEHRDEDARIAWADRMDGLRDGCEAAIKALKNDGELRAGITIKEASDTLWTLMTFQNWQHLRQTCGWSQERYANWLIDSAERLLLAD